MAIASADLISRFYQPGDPGPGEKDERRRRHRLRLQLPVHFQPGKDQAPVASTTRDISSDGFLCLTPRPFEKGESLVCTITWPSHLRGMLNKPLVIRCDITVVRCEHDEESGLYRTACHIQEFECNHSCRTAAVGR
jgi:hypothetical protein